MTRWLRGYAGPVRGPRATLDRAPTGNAILDPVRARRLLRVIRTAPWSANFGLAITALYLFVAMFAPILAPYPETAIVAPAFEPWGSKFLLGTDNLGRDMLSRLIYGARNTIGIAIGITGLSVFIGTFAGLLAATVGGWLDQIIARLVDTLMAIPQLIFALLLLTIFGTSIPVLIGVIAILDATRIFRLTRALGMNIVSLDFVDAARLRGESVVWIIRRELLPNVVTPLLAESGLRFCFVFLTISALSFLGLGIQPPTADWGSMVRDTAPLITYGDITPLLPAAAIALLTVSVNFIVDWWMHRTDALLHAR